MVFKKLCLREEPMRHPIRRMSPQTPAQVAYGQAYRPTGRSVPGGREGFAVDNGFQAEEALSSKLAEIFPGVHEHLDARNGNTFQKADLRSTVGENVINSSMKTFAGWDNASPNGFYNNATAHSPLNNRAGIGNLLGASGNGSLMDAINLFRDGNFRFSEGTEEKEKSSRIL